MVAKVDGNLVSADALWWPAMNFDQFGSNARIGQYELQFPRAEFVQGLAATYAQCVRELREDDSAVPDQDSSPLRDAGYPELDVVLEHPAARFELLNVYMPEDVLAAFIPYPPSAAARFMINSVDDVSTLPESVSICGRGYYGAPGFAPSGGTASG